MVPHTVKDLLLPNTVNQKGEKLHTVGLDDTALPHIKIENTAWKKAQYRKALVPFWKGNLFKIYF